MIEIIIYGTIALFILLVYFWNENKWRFVTPSNEADWIPNHKRLAFADIHSDGTSVKIHNVRNTFYDSKQLYTPRYFNYSCKSSDLMSASLHMSHKHGVTVHVFITFLFKDGNEIALSIKPRRIKTLPKIFTGLALIINPPEIIHAIATKKDIFTWRTQELHERIVSYNLTLPKDEIWSVFIDLLKKAKTVMKKPTFYSLISNNCFSNIFNSINACTEHSVPTHHYSYTFSPFLDTMLLKQGLISKQK